MSAQIIQTIRSDAAAKRAQAQALIPSLKAARLAAGTVHCPEWRRIGDQVSSLEHEANRLDALADSTEARLITEQLAQVLAKHTAVRRHVLRRAIESLST